jgi:ribosome biogenesis protein Nip4
MKSINNFVRKFNTRIFLEEKNIINKGNRYYIVSEDKQKYLPGNFFYTGTYLGTLKGQSFFPSFLLLDMISKTKSNKLVVGNKTAWLFICGRDIFRRGIVEGAQLKKGEYTLVLNQMNECLGYGKILINLRGPPDSKQVAVKNILDIGDFLRREKSKSRN